MTVRHTTRRLFSSRALAARPPRAGSLTRSRGGTGRRGRVPTTSGVRQPGASPGQSTCARAWAGWGAYRTLTHRSGRGVPEPSVRCTRHWPTRSMGTATTQRPRTLALWGSWLCGAASHPRGNCHVIATTLRNCAQPALGGSWLCNAASQPHGSPVIATLRELSNLPGEVPGDVPGVSGVGQP